MKALLVIDVQEAIVSKGDFTKQLSVIEELSAQFKQDQCPVIFLKHVSQDEDSPFHESLPSSAIIEKLVPYADHIIKKETPNAYFETSLQDIVTEKNVTHLFITGFNAEFCCMFTTVASHMLGYKVTYLEDAVSSVNAGSEYEMDDLDVPEFIATVFHWSNVVEVLTEEEYKELYK